MKSLILALTLSVAAGVAHAGHPMVEMQTNQGNIVVELYPDKAPKTVENFLRYVKNGFYEGTVFHRVVKNFMVQGGAFDKTLNWRKGDDPIQCEAKNGLTNEAGTIAMARARDPDSATTQFFFNLESNKHLNHHRDHPDYYGHAVFGKIVKGMDVMQKIAGTQTGASGPFAADVPVEPIVIEKVALLPEEPESPPTTVKAKSKGKTNGKSKNQPRRILAGT
jgi:peptidyl-prolyl cis-trans isomerase A (cyclophilin A)/peptidyl-prolyl cis-trans isomerase B (cyclophilin B)